MKDTTPKIRVVKSTYYSNWGDRIGYPVASLFVKPLSKLSFVTPNGVTLTAFFLFALGCFSLFIQYPYHLFVAALLIFAGYIGDDIDGQLARVTKKYSVIGDYMDKVLDIMKIFLITFSLGFAVYLQTHQIVYLILGFVACFFFNYRYYMKLESMFSAYSNNNDYFEQSAKQRSAMEHEMDVLYAQKAKTFKEAVRLFIIKNRTILWVDEAEFAIFTSIGALANRLDIALWVIAISQVIIAFWRLFERGHQLKTKSSRLLWPMRK